MAPHFSFIYMRAVTNIGLIMAIAVLNLSIKGVSIIYGTRGAMKKMVRATKQKDLI